MNIETLYLVVIASLSIATILLTIIGIQIILLLKEARAITKRADDLSKGLVSISHAFENSLREISTFADGAKFVTTIVGRLINAKKNDKQK